MSNISVVIPNLNGEKSLKDCIDSLLSQSNSVNVIIVENGSKDNSLDYIQTNYPSVELIFNERNLGFAKGVNQGIKRSIELNDKYVALFNNDAIADKHWLENLVNKLEKNNHIGIATCKFVSLDKKHLDSTGDQYTVWGLPYPRGRGEDVSNRYDESPNVFAASGGASLYRVNMLKEIGLFDEDFFAYYEDIDISFRAQLAGWKVAYVPEAIAYHQIGATSSKIKGFTTYQTIKNLPWLFIKNVPSGKPFNTVLPRFTIAYLSFIFSALSRGQIWPVFKGLFISLTLTPKKLAQRKYIQKNKKVTSGYIFDMMVHDLPPNATKLRRLRSVWRKV